MTVIWNVSILFGVHAQWKSSLKFAAISFSLLNCGIVFCFYNKCKKQFHFTLKKQDRGYFKLKSFVETIRKFNWKIIEKCLKKKKKKKRKKAITSAFEGETLFSV